MESYSVEAILTATDRTFSSTMSSAERSMAGVNKQSGELGMDWIKVPLKVIN